jgi:ABC-2 type transport system ATP-binding protein
VATDLDVEPVLDCAHLARRFGGRVAVEDVSFRIEPGETYGLLGPNGAGKTTTISMVAGVLAPDAGEVTVAGRSIHINAGVAKRAIGLVPQDVALYPDLTGRENLRFFGRLQGLAGSELHSRIDQVLEVVGLTDRAGDRIDSYSGGMKRRANIAAGLLHRPRLLILDEPTAGVDPQSRNQIVESIEVLGGEGLAVLYTTHYMEEAERLCDRVGIIDGGRLVAEGTRTELVAQVGSHASVTVRVVGDATLLAERARRATGVLAADLRDGSTLTMVTADVAGVLSGVVRVADEVGASLAAVEVDEPDLEDVFLHLTGKALRDR